jgi:hypothetical protein
MSRSALFTLVAVSGLAACSLSAKHDGGSGAVGQVHAAISQVPPFTYCVKVVAAGSRTVTRTVDVTPGQTDASVDLDNVAIGEVDFAGFAYGGACAGLTDTSQPTYASALTAAAVQPGQVTNLELTLLPVGGAHVGINFGDSDGGVDFDGGVPFDGGGVPDLSVPPDFSVPADLSVPPDLAQSALVANPGQLLFEPTAGTYPQQAVSVLNAGFAPLPGLSFSIIGADASRFTFTGNGVCVPGSTLPPGAPCTVVVGYIGPMGLPANATLHLQAAGSSTDVLLHAN